ncbi:ABC transporter ATP-binding protein [Saccharospirillum salsuginis]|uniref:ABC transporter ATP-binding protein n=1 Tax=Saccharospirillum salsuginis TaxID=418750 RepID=A0A918NBB5_9GAMM|nr:ABC transporter ATP-binding protein [Saccharospirillum salsuginis]GGX57923.1 ABC transporter ATP-binding protein [Saccharospirillum salsuginis]
MLTLTDIARYYQGPMVETIALDAVNLSINEGEFVAVMGPSGCGKSTLLNVLGLLDSPTRGRYRWHDRDIGHWKEARRSEWRKQHIGFVFQNFNLINELTIEENIELALLYRKVASKERRRRVADVMDQVGIAHRARHYPAQLSGGQQQRVAVARAIVGEPSLILADEPTGNLDSQQGQHIMDILSGLNQAGTTVVMVTHDAHNADHAHRTVNLFDGRIVLDNVRLAS